MSISIILLPLFKHLQAKDYWQKQVMKLCLCSSCCCYLMYWLHPFLSSYLHQSLTFCEGMIYDYYEFRSDVDVESITEKKKYVNILSFFLQQLSTLTALFFDAGIDFLEAVDPLPPLICCGFQDLSACSQFEKSIAVSVCRLNLYRVKVKERKGRRFIN